MATLYNSIEAILLSCEAVAPSLSTDNGKFWCQVHFLWSWYGAKVMGSRFVAV